MRWDGRGERVTLAFWGLRRAGPMLSGVWLGLWMLDLILQALLSLTKRPRVAYLPARVWTQVWATVERREVHAAPPPGPTAAIIAPTGGRGHAPAYHRPQRLRQELSLPDPGRPVAHVRRRAVQAPPAAHVLHPSEVRGRSPGSQERIARFCPPESEGWQCLHLPSGRGPAHRAAS